MPLPEGYFDGVTDFCSVMEAKYIAKEYVPTSFTNFQWVPSEVPEDLKFLVEKFVENLPEGFIPNLDSPSYVRVEVMPQGHLLHADGCKLEEEEETGDLIIVPNHMSWCKMSGSLRLTPQDDVEEGGVMTFVDPDGEIFREFDGDNHYRVCLIYSSNHLNPEGFGPVFHKVSPHEGCRLVLLFFFDGEWSEE